MKTLQDQYRLIKEGKGHKGVFLKEAKTQFPQYIRNASTFDETTLILKDKGIINENIVGVGAINSPFIVKEKESYETAFEKYLGEAKKKEETKTGVKAVEKQTSQEVENILSHNYDQKDNKDINNLIFDQVMTGYYAEMKDPKNADKTMEELKSIVCKNLEKDPIYYTKNGQFGVKDLGYETEVPGLGTPKEPKGPYKSSGYGTLKEGKINFQDQKYFNDARDLAYGMGLDRYTERQLTSAITTMEMDSKEIQDLHPEFDEDILQLLPTVFAKLDNEVIFNGTKYKVIDRGEYNITLEDGEGNQINPNYSQFKKGEYKPNLQETKLRKVINTLVKHQIQENVQKELQQIDKEAQFEILASKLEKIEAAVEKRQSQLDRLDEDEDLKNLTDKKKLKALAKDIKVLEKAKSKIEKILSKKDKSEMSQPEIIDDGMIDEADGDVDDAKTTADEMERAAAAAKEIGDTELFEEDEDEISESKI
jgi:hypothetical protein|tara:strand:+ start:5658 stop:7094 length:1437 start_codon:yes stop_codon:yes gene_type:complete